jgi:sporulation protein YlmC with PRC-barrel domain
MKVKKLNGMKVITADAYTLGEIGGAHFDTANWKITNLDINLTKESSKELGLRKPVLMSLSVCLPVAYIKHIGDVITLKQSLEEFKSLEECAIE